MQTEATSTNTGAAELDVATEGNGGFDTKDGFPRVLAGLPAGWTRRARSACRLPADHEAPLPQWRPVQIEA